MLMSSRRHTLLVLSLLIVGMVLVRLPHMRGPIDDPHSVRQGVVAYGARVFYEEGFDLLHPRVCWMGDYRITASQFPLVEATIALGYRVFGERTGVARMVALLSFLGSAAYLFAILQYVYGMRLAAVATAVYGLLPIGLFYSRAVHPDPPVILAAHGMVYHFLRGYDEKKRFHIAVGGVWALFGFLVKASHVFYFALPLMLWIVTRFDRRSFLLLVLASCPGVAAFFLWRWHCFITNCGAPDWFFIPGYHCCPD
ncbi:glycosyltransferase family 39 protein [Candidatus Sumerlaeota bacterium]|nr:glycosyltransferase family 39 protein [Candidatus Sumerlaeota bacterium]